MELGLTAVGRLLAGLEITPQKPLRRAYERDPKAVEFWLKQSYPKLKRRAKRLGANIRVGIKRLGDASGQRINLDAGDN